MPEVFILTGLGILSILGATMRRQHSILVASCYQHLTGQERLYGEKKNNVCLELVKEAL
jgi:hypothetical protein